MGYYWILRWMLFYHYAPYLSLFWLLITSFRELFLREEAIIDIMVFGLGFY